MGRAETWLTELVSAVADEPAERVKKVFTSLGEMEGGEQEIAPLSDYLRRLWSVVWTRNLAVKSEMLRAVADAVASGDNEPSDEVKSALELKLREAQLGFEIFWFVTRLEHNLTEGEVGVRRHGLLVRRPPEAPTVRTLEIPAGVLKVLMEGGLLPESTKDFKDA